MAQISISVLMIADDGRRILGASTTDEIVAATSPQDLAGQSLPMVDEMWEATRARLTRQLDVVSKSDG